MAGQLDLQPQVNELNKELAKLEKRFGSVVKSLNEVANASDKLNKEINDSENSFEKLNKTTKETKAVNDKLIKSEKELTASQKEVQKINERSNKVTKDVIRAQELLTQKKKKLREEVRKEIGVTKQNISFTQRMANGYKLAVIQIAAVAAALSIVIKGARAYIKLTKEVRKQTTAISRSFELTRKNAEKLVPTIRGIAAAFDQEFNDVLKSATILSKEFGITASEALDLINDGFEKGANINGEFLELLKEYPTQLKAVGLTAKETVAIITQTEQAGLFSDKGIDAIKEGGLRLRENTKAVQDALIPLDDQLKKQIKINIENGKTFEAIKLVSGALENTNLTAEQTQKIITDVFGGAGEDAGIRFLSSLKDINTNLDEVNSNLSDSELATIRWNKSLEEFKVNVLAGGKATNSLFASIQNAGSDALDKFTNLRAEGGTLAATLQTIASAIVISFQIMGQTIDIFLIQPFQSFFNIMDDIKKNGITGIGAAFKNEFKGVADDFKEFNNGIVGQIEKIKKAYEGTGKIIEKELVEPTKKAQEVTKTVARERVELEKLSSIQVTEIKNEQLKESLANTEQANQEEIDLTAEQNQLKVDIANQLFSLGSSLRERELSDIESKRKHELDLAGDNAIAQDKINKKFDKERSKILRKQAIADKAQGVFNAAINTAIGVTNALSKIVTAPLAPFIAAAGALQVAAIVAKPIPKFKTGVKDFHGGMAIVGDGGQELIKTQDNQMFLTPNTDTLVNLPKGADVIPNRETESILKNNTSLDVQILVDEQIKTRKAINNQPKQTLNITANGWKATTRKNNTIQHKIDTYMK